MRAAAGATAVAGASGSATAASEEGEESGGDGGSVEVAVGPGGNFVFDPDSMTIPPGTRVAWEWESNNHNVVPESQPDGATWEGEGEQGVTFDEGHSYSHTFETEGTYEYVCTPHKTAGMVASLTVEEGASLPGEESEGGGGGPSIPDGAKSIGVATTVAMVTTLGLAFTLLKYGGGQPEE
jgi:plastocyanin